MTSSTAIRLLATAHRSMLWHRVEEMVEKNRLLVATIAGFLGLYCVAAYVLVSRGLDFINKTPLFGPLLTERLVYVMFFFFFVMLIISNATITGMGLFRRKDMEWQVALPLPYRSLVLWKTLEGMALASWGLLLLSAPILLALGQLYQGGLSFYLLSIPALLCLVTIAANLSTWLLLLIVRYAQRWWWRPVAVVAAVILASGLVRFWTITPDTISTTDLVANLQEVLKHTEICMHPLMPSSWVAEVLFSGRHGLDGQAGFFLLTLLANALFSLVVTVRLGAALFYPAWNRVMSSVPVMQMQAHEKAWFRQPQKNPQGRVWRWLLRMDRASHAVLVKDIRTFLREPTQWGQCLLVFGLLLMYTSNLRRLGYDLQNPFWTLVISHLNLLVCCLALSTLTTRFVFPQFSMEGQRLWILGLSPLPLVRVLSLKMRLIAGVLALLTALLVVMSSLSLELPLPRAAFFCAAVIMLSYGLTALALALGALLPNFREPNPARVISGFGGTLCLIGSFLYILGSSAALAIPDAVAWRANLYKMPLGPREIWLGQAASLVFVALLTVVFGGIPWVMAKKRTKNLDYLKEL
jgi:ABC-2 type transport system permease protein